MNLLHFLLPRSGIALLQPLHVFSVVPPIKMGNLVVTPHIFHLDAFSGRIKTASKFVGMFL
jgi:hypothetical protein